MKEERRAIEFYRGLIQVVLEQDLRSNVRREKKVDVSLIAKALAQYVPESEYLKLTIKAPLRPNITNPIDEVFPFVYEALAALCCEYKLLASNATNIVECADLFLCTVKKRFFLITLAIVT